MNMNNTYITKDLGIAAMLLSQGISILSIIFQGRIAYFSFEHRTVCEKLATDYDFGEVQVNAKTYFSNLKLLKRKVFDRLNFNKIPLANE